VLPVGEDEDMAAWLNVPVGVFVVQRCSRVVVRCSGLYVGNAREAFGHVVFVYGRVPKVASLGS
jgi:hypothetical protein